MSTKYKSKLSLMVVLAIVIVIITVNKLGSNPKFAQQYEFPLQSDDIENVLTEEKIDWHITDHSIVNDSHNIFTLKNDKNITLGINSQVRDNHKVLSITWFLPSSLIEDEVDDFFKNQLSSHFELPGIFYGNKKGLDKALDVMLSYYLDEENYDKGLIWNKRVGNDHLKAQIKPMSPNERNQVITLLIIPNELFEDYLRTLNDGWKRVAAENNIKVFNSTVDEMQEAANKDIPPVNDRDIFSKHFIIHGSLEDIKESKKVPKSFMNINSNLIKPNKDKYLSAKLVDDTGSVNVLVEMTSLNQDELKIERNHNVVMLYNDNEPVYVVRSSVLYTEELRAQEIAKDFISDLYTVNSEEVDNYNESAINLIISDPKELAEAMQINDEVLKSLMTDNAYDTLAKNRQNLMFTQACYEGNYTMQVAEIKLSENKNNIENNEAGYNFELQSVYISRDATRTTGTSKGLIELDKIDGNWKVTGFRIIK